MRIGFLSHIDQGHLNPMTALARQVQACGHEVLLFAHLDAAATVEAAGVKHVAFAEEEFPLGSASRKSSEQSRLFGEEAMLFSVCRLQNTVAAIFRYLPGLLSNSALDGLVLDPIHLGAGIIPASLGVPYAHTYLAMHFDFTGATPFCTFPWPHETTPAALARNKAGVQALMALLTPFYAQAESYAANYGLEVDFSDPFATLSPLALITQVPREFDFPGDQWPSQFRYAGPFSDGAGRLPHSFPWGRLNGKPIIYASMGTLQNGLKHVFEIIGEVATGLPEYQFVVSLGPVLSSHEIETFPEDAIVLAHIPQIELLKRAILCVTHAGLNTTLEALAEGVPLVAIPITNDQPGVATRIQYTGVGESVPLAELTRESLDQAVRKVLSGSDYREAALRLRDAIQQADGLRSAATHLELVFSKEAGPEARPRGTE